MAACLEMYRRPCSLQPLSLITITTSVDFNVWLEALGLNKLRLLILSRRAEAQTRRGKDGSNS